MIAKHMTTSEIAALFGLSRSHVGDKIRKLFLERKIDAKKEISKKGSEIWLVPEDEVNKHFKVNKKFGWGKKQKIILHFRRKFPDADMIELHRLITKFGVEISLNYVRMVANHNSQTKTKNVVQTRTAKQTKTVLSTSHEPIRQMVNIISSMPKEYDILKVIEIARAITKEFKSLNEAEATAETIIKIANRLASKT